MLWASLAAWGPGGLEAKDKVRVSLGLDTRFGWSHHRLTCFAGGVGRSRRGRSRCTRRGASISTLLCSLSFLLLSTRRRRWLSRLRGRCEHALEIRRHGGSGGSSWRVVVLRNKLIGGRQMLLGLGRGRFQAVLEVLWRRCDDLRRTHGCRTERALARWRNSRGFFQLGNYSRERCQPRQTI